MDLIRHFLNFYPSLVLTAILCFSIGIGKMNVEKCQRCIISRISIKQFYVFHLSGPNAWAEIANAKKNHLYCLCEHSCEIINELYRTFSFVARKKNVSFAYYGKIKSFKVIWADIEFAILIEIYAKFNKSLYSTMIDCISWPVNFSSYLPYLYRQC